MKKLITLTICLTAIFMAQPAAAMAATVTASDETPSQAQTQIQIQEQEQEQLDEYSSQVTEGINSAIDGETRELMRENGAEDGDISGVTLGSVTEMVREEIAESSAEPLRTLARLIAVLILTAAVRSFAQGAMSEGYAVIGLLASITIIYRSVYGAFEGVCTFLDKLSAFMLSYIPIFASVSAASGSFAAGGTYYASTLGICELIAFVSERVIMPFLSLFMALSFTAAINPDMHFSEAANSVKNAVKTTLTALMTVFTGLISVKSIAGSAADSAASRAVRFGASSFIPIIGSSVSEAYSTVYAGIGVIRSAAGTAGIAAAGFMLLKPVVALMLVKAVLGAAGLVSDMLGLSEPSELIKSTGYAMSAAISTVVCFAMMFIVSTAVLMLTAANR